LDLPLIQQQEVQTLLSALHRASDQVVVQQLEWYRLLMQLREFIRTSGGDAQLFLSYLQRTYPHESAANIQEKLKKLHQLLLIAEGWEDEKAGAALAFFERLCTPGWETNEELPPASVQDGALSQLRAPGHQLKLRLHRFLAIASLIPTIKQWCIDQNQDFEAQLRKYLYEPQRDVRIRIVSECSSTKVRNS
jgi:hypothetical protein